MAIDSEQLKLSILIPTIPERSKALQKLLKKLQSQLRDRSDVEILCLLDNRSLEIAEKRNALLDLARATHVAFLDDDDDVSDDYVSQILGAIHQAPLVDVITFHQTFRLNGKPGRVLCAVEHPNEPLTPAGLLSYRDMKRPPFHWCVWKRDLASSERFLPKFSGRDRQSIEDADWLQRLYPKVGSSHKIDRFLHHYEFDERQTASRLNGRGESTALRRLKISLRKWIPLSWLISDKVP